MSTHHNITMVDAKTKSIQTRVLTGTDLDQFVTSLQDEATPPAHPARDVRWLCTLQTALGHTPYLIEVSTPDGLRGQLALCLVQSSLFGKFLVGLPYINYGGVDEVDSSLAQALIDGAVDLAASLDVKHLELRHESHVDHPALTETMTTKVHMRMVLPDTADTLWSEFKPKVRNQIRKGEKQDFGIHWGRLELLEDFYAVFSRNMRDLGTPVFGRRLFATILQDFPDAELCVLHDTSQPVAGALLVHGRHVTEVPSASALRAYNSKNVNMLMYWHLLQRAIARGQDVFDFGRSTMDGSTYRFKKQWGAAASPAVWQYHVLKGDIGTMRRESGKYRWVIRAWKQLPLAVANRMGPWIVRGIP